MKLNPLKSIVFITALSASASVFAETVWIDVRSSIEHAIDSIEGDPLIAHDEIVPEISALYPDKDTQIRLYCRSGGRAGKAMGALLEAGYMNVSNAGSIEDARRERGLQD